MRIPLTKYGRPQTLLLPAILLLIMAVLLVAGVKYLSVRTVLLLELVPAGLCIYILTFFRDPERLVPQDKNLLLSPADGRITDIEIVNESEFIEGRAVRIGIFLSIFNVHINRAPCNVCVKKISYKKGKFTNAMFPRSGQINESNDLWLTRIDPPRERLIVRQISGAVARRIVCEAREGQNLTGGQRFGMIKFGSRTELYVPKPEDKNTATHAGNEIEQKPKLLVKVGDKAKAGLTPILRFEQW